jgi:nucleoside-diphosphate-sugar epimerase
LKIFVTGASGYIGGSVAARLLRSGHQVRGLVRDRAKADAVAAFGVDPVVGLLENSGLLAEEARSADGVVNAASSDNQAAVEAILSGLTGSGKPFLHTSGSSVVADQAMGEPSEQIHYETTPIHPLPERAARLALDRRILTTAGIRPVVLCNSMIYGHALGPDSKSVQVPILARQARSSGIARYIGRGLNRWSNAHIADVAELYALALERAVPGAFLYVESGEECLRNIAAAIANRFGLNPPQSWPADEAIAVWGRERAVYSLGSNSRVRGRIASEDLGWVPTRRSITRWIIDELA